MFQRRAGVPAFSDPTAEDTAEETDRAAEGMAAVHVGLWVSATRCVLTYVIAPLLGAVGFVLGPLGLVLQLLGAVTATSGARRLWVLSHRLRLPYALVALLVDLVSAGALVHALHGRWVA